MTYDSIIDSALLDAFSQISNTTPTPDINSMKDTALDTIQQYITIANFNYGSKKSAYAIPKKLSNYVISRFMLFLYDVKNIYFTTNKSDAILAFYNPEDGIYYLYPERPAYINNLIRQFSKEMTTKDIAEVVSYLSDTAELATPCNNPDYVPLNNGIFDYKSKQLKPFTPKLIFVAKSSVNYNPNATNIVLHNDDDNTNWDVESWVADLSYNPEVVNLLWQIIGAILRPNVSWNKAIFFTNTVGNNGKGTLCVMLRELCSKVAPLSLDDFQKEFSLSMLIGALANIADENDVDSFNKSNRNFKTAVTGDMLNINIKYQNPVQYIFKGLIIECLNDLPKFSDKTDSLYRRQLFVPFDKCFTGIERPYIKDQYMKNKDVLEYVVYKVLTLMPDYYRFDEPQACKDMLDTVKVNNSPIRQFVADFFEPDYFHWDLVPYTFLYDLYKAWFAKNVPSGKVQSRNPFLLELKQLLKTDYSDKWFVSNKKFRVKTRMDKPEHLIVQYGLTDWMNPMYRGGDTDKICTPALHESYRGILRLSAMDASDINDTNDNTKDDESKDNTITSNYMHN